MHESFASYISSTDPRDLDIAGFMAHDDSFTVADLSGLSSFIYSDLPEQAKADFIISTREALKHQEENRIHKKNSQKDLYEKYIEYASPDYVLSKDKFDKYAKYINRIELEPSELACNSKTVKAISGLRNKDVSDENILNAYQKLCNLQTVTLTDLWPYIDEYTLNDDPEYRLALTDFLKNINTKSSDILDFLCYLSIDETCNDYILENRFVLPRIVVAANNLDDSAPVVLFEPSMFFIRRWRYRYPTGNKKTVLIIQDEQYCSLLKTCLTADKNFIVKSVNEIDDIYGDPNLAPSVTAMFLNHDHKEQVAAEYISKIIEMASAHHRLCLFGADSQITSKSSQMYQLIPKDSVYSIDLIPGGIQNATLPKRKVYLQADYGYCEKNLQIELKQLTLRNEHGESLSDKEFSTTIASEAFSDTPEKIRSIFREDSLNYFSKGTTQRTPAKTVQFSNEISIAYTVSGDGSISSPYRVAAHMLLPPQGKKKAQRIPGCSASTKLYDENDIENWVLNVFPNLSITVNRQKTSVQEKTIEVYIPILDKRSVSLKTFIYLHPELKTRLPKYAESILSDISSSSLGEYSLIKISHFVLENYIEFSVASDITPRQYKSIFTSIFDYAIECNNCNINPAKSIVLNDNNDHEGLDEVRDALTYKYLLIQQIEKMIKHALKLIAKGDHALGIAMILRIYTGLESNIVCGFVWRDYITDGVPSLWVHHQLRNDGTEYVPFTQRYYERKLPIIPFVKDILDKEMKRQLEVIALGDMKYLMNCSIVSGSDYVINGETRIMSPAKLNRKLRSLVKQFGLDPIMVTLPDDNGGTVETNLAYYPSDIFKSNYWHYVVKEHSDIEDGVLSYFLGRTPPTTGDENYIDYGTEENRKVTRKFQVKMKGK